MGNYFDTTIRHALNQWANLYEPPTSGRARLLLLASMDFPKFVHISSFRRFERTPHARSSHAVVDMLQAPWMWRLSLA
jgi:hypothetical protein